MGDDPPCDRAATYFDEAELVLRMTRREEAIVCAECGIRSGERARGWRALLAVEEAGDGDTIEVFCPACARREFGDE